MTNLIAEIFKRFVGFAAGLLFVSSLVGGLAVLTVSGSRWEAWALLIGGPVIVVMSFGTLALMIQNNELLKRIAAQQLDGAARSSGGRPEVRGVRREPSLRADR